MNPYAGRMRAMLMFAFVPVLALFAQPLGQYSAWWPAIIIGLAGAAHRGVERQLVFDYRRHVPNVYSRFDCRYWYNGGRYQFVFN